MGSETTFLYEIAAGAHIAVHTEKLPSNEEWKSYLDHIAAHFDDVRGLIVHAPGGNGPNAMQRAIATEHWEKFGRTPTMAIMTFSPFLKGAVTALSWFLGKKVKAFGAGDFEDVGKYLGLASPEIAVVRATVDRLRKKQGLPGLT
jgi:hypothetical protein